MYKNVFLIVGLELKTRNQCFGAREFNQIMNKNKMFSIKNVICGVYFRRRFGLVNSINTFFPTPNSDFISEILNPAFKTVLCTK